MKVVRIGKLVLDFSFVLDLEMTFYIPSFFSRNFILVLRLLPLGYSFEFYKTCFCFFYNSSLVGNGIFCDGLSQICLQSNVSYNVMYDQVNDGIKYSAMIDIYLYYGIGDWDIFLQRELNSW